MGRLRIREAFARVHQGEALPLTATAARLTGRASDGGSEGKRGKH
jgi:hypothetical protein